MASIGETPNKYLYKRLSLIDYIIDIMEILKQLLFLIKNIGLIIIIF